MELVNENKEVRRKRMRGLPGPKFSRKMHENFGKERESESERDRERGLRED